MFRSGLVAVFVASSLAVCAQSSYVPLTELKNAKYEGYEGGLYPGGSNKRPAAYEAAGLRLARQVVPRDASGKPDANGKIGLLTVGMSNTRAESEAWGMAIRNDSEVNPHLVFVNGAQGGQTGAIVADESGRGANYWANVDRALQQAGISAAQVQAIWLKEADAGPSGSWVDYAKRLQQELATICQIVHRKFPYARLCYVSNRIYGGYATTKLNPEPYAYASGFSVKWLIEDQIMGPSDKPKSPWLSWGPYLWANGTHPNPDGLTWSQSEFAGDGTHPNRQGAQKVADLLMKFFKTDSTTRPWFVR